MKLSLASVAATVLASAAAVNAATWSFSEASVAVKGKGAGIDGAAKQKYAS